MCHHSTHKAKCKCRSVTDCHGNKSRQNRKHKTKCHITDLFEHNCRRSNRPKIRALGYIQGIHIYHKTIDQKGNGDQNTTANYKRKHMGNTIHQLGVNLVSHTAAGLILTL